MDDASHLVRLVGARAPRVHARTLALLSVSGLVATGAIFAPAHLVEAAAQERSGQLTGRPVGDVLDSLRAQGLTFIYNTQLVTPQMRVLSEPSARGGIAMAEEILAAHGLGVRRVTAGVYAVVPGRRKSGAPAPPVAPIEEVVVQTSRYSLHSEYSVAQTLLTSDDIQSLPSLGDEPLRAVQRLPGMAGNGYSSLGAVRGAQPNETAIVLDGLRLYEPFHLKNFLSPVSLLDSRVIRSMQVYSGGFPVVHGDRMSAIIDAQTLGPEQPTYYEAGLSLFHANLLGSVQFDEGRGRALVSFRRSNLGELAQFSEQDFGKPEYFDGLARLDYRLNDTSRFAIEYLASNDRIVALRNSAAERAETEYRNHYLWGTFQHDWSDGARSRLIVSYTDISNERDGLVDEPGRRNGRVHDFRNFHVVGLRADHEFGALGLEHRLGLEVRRLWGGYDYRSDVRLEAGFPFPGAPARELRRAAAPKPDGFESGAWWDGRLTLDDRWTLQAGLRVDTQTYDGSGDHEQIAPRLNVLYAWNDSTRIRATWGRFHQAQAINELQVEDGVDRFRRAQHADHSILAIDHAFAPGLDLRIEAYRKVYRQIHPRFENLFNPLVLLPEIEFDRVMVAPSSARAEGGEVLLRWDSQGPWRAWVGYAWSRVSDRVDGRRVPRSWDQEHAITAGVSWASGPWSVAITDTFHTGWPITRLDIVETADGRQRPIVGQRNAARLGDYNSLDLRVTRTYALPRGALDVFFEATNMLSRENECCVEYTLTGAPDGSMSLREEVDHWLPLVPSIGVLWRY